MHILVTGAAEFIGSHTCVELLEKGYTVSGIDNFVNSKPEVLKRITEITGRSINFTEGDVCDEGVLAGIFSSEQIDAVIHFAGLKAVGESVALPLKYYHNNLLSTISLVKVMQRHGVRKIIFSSSATVYGAPATVPITEDFPLTAVNPYGATKLMCENILRDVWASEPGWSVCLLRYFNPIGAHASGLLGEEPQGIPNNLMPYIVKVAAGELPFVRVFGNDYPTVDGTGVRDYLHVVDLAEGHVKALAALPEGEVSVYNLGTGQGYSVLQLINTFAEVNGIKVPYEITERRPGDAAECFAEVTKAERELGWRTRYSLADMCRDNWHYALVNSVKK